jgi:hypothetical protein
MKMNSGKWCFSENSSQRGGKIRLCRQSNAYGRLFFRMYAEKVPF